MALVTDRPTGARGQTPGPRWSRNRLTAVAALAVLFAAAIAVFTVTRDTTSDTVGSRALGAQRIAATQAACDQWRTGLPPTVGATPPSDWCAGMAGWMSGQPAASHMAASTMWNDAHSMQDACRQWTGLGGGTVGAGWCDQMAVWMSRHMGSWNDSHDWDSHMGDWGAGMMTR